MAYHPRSMFLDDSQMHSQSPYGTPRGLSHRKSRSDVSSDYEQDRMGLVRTNSDFSRTSYERPVGLMRTGSDYDSYDRLPQMGDRERDFEWEGERSPRGYERERDLRQVRIERGEPKLRHRKSHKRMFEVPAALTNMFDSGRDRGRGYFQSESESRFALHSLLDANAVRNGSPHVRFDILRPLDIRIGGDGQTHDPRVLDEPATYPAISKLRVLVADLPWIIRVQNRQGVTLRDIAEAVITFLRSEMSPREWSMLDGAHKIAARRAFTLQQSGGISGGLRRFECLVETTMFMGMVKDDALVRRVAGDDAAEWTWVMLGPR